MRKKYTYLSLLDRRKLRRFLREGQSIEYCSKKIGKSKETVRREIKLGGGWEGYDAEESDRAARARRAIRSLHYGHPRKL